MKRSLALYAYLALAAAGLLSSCDSSSSPSPDWGGNGSSSTAGWNTSITYGSLTDARDGQVYKTVKIGMQTWMAENLKTKVDSSWCYENSAGMCSKYGRLYKWAAMMGLDASYDSKLWDGSLPRQGICPSGWHVPSDAEWTILANAIGGTSTLGVKLKSSGGWYVGGAAKDDYGFRGIPGGARYGDKFSSVGIAAYFWSSSEYSATNAWNRSLYSITDSLGHEFGYKREFAYSVRCLEGAGSGASSGGTGTAVPWNSSIRYGSLTDSRDGNTYRTVTIGTQTWMAENLNYKLDNSWCYSYSADSCAKYGRLYQWATVMGLDASFNNKLWGGTLPRQGICPSGWHVPSDAEWSTLAAVIGDPVGSQLKSTSDWYNSGSGTDAYGFRAMPGGDVIGENFTSVGHYGYWWSATERDFSSALHLTIYNFSDSVYHNDLGKIAGFSLRCVQN